MSPKGFSSEKKNNLDNWQEVTVGDGIIDSSDITATDNSPPQFEIPYIPSKLFLFTAAVMVVRGFVAWHTTENDSLAFRLLQSVLQLRGPSNRTADIVGSALTGLAGIFAYTKRQFAESHNDERLTLGSSAHK